MLPTLFLLTDLTIQQTDERIVCKCVQAGVDLCHRIEGVESLGSRSQLRFRLRTADQEHGHDRGGSSIEIELLVGHLAISSDAAAVRWVDDPHQTLRLHGGDRGIDLELVERHDRLSRRRLVACQDEGVHRQWILVGNGAFLFHQTAKDTALDHGEHVLELTAAGDDTHTMHDVIRLRQVVIAARDLDATVGRLCADLGLRVCFNDPSVAEFGLRNALLTVGDQFIEVVSPLANATDTAAGRLLDRRQAEATAYMVMFEVDDLDQRMATLTAAGVRTVWSGDLVAIRGRHLHPGDIGGAIVSLDETDPKGSWHWAGPNWTAHSDNSVVGAIAGYTIGVDDPATVTRRWSQFGLTTGVHFIEGTNSEIELVATDRNTLAQTVTIDQVTLRLV